MPASNKRQNNVKVVVTGGAGFIGSHVTDALVLRGFEVHVIDNLSAGKKENVNPKAVFHRADIRELAALSPIIKGAQFVFHLAALPRVQYSIEHPKETHDVNVTGTLNVLMASKEGGVMRVIYSASSSAYGNQKTLPLREDMIPMPKSPYGLHKYIGEQYALFWHKLYKIPVVSLRYFNVFGPRQRIRSQYAAVVPRFIDSVLKNEYATIYGDGNQSRDFCYVDNVILANILAMQSKSDFNGEVFNVAHGSQIKVNEVKKVIEKYTNKKLDLEKRPPRLGDVRHTHADISKAKRLLGYNPTVNFNEGLKQTIEWFKSRKI